MNILVLGGGGREHALIWKLAQSPSIRKIYCIPGNPGISRLAETSDISLQDFPRIRSFIEEKEIDLTVVGPEQPLVEGIVDFLESEKMAVFGPNASAARLEGSKVFSKKFMKKHRIPTAFSNEFSDYQKAREYLTSYPSERVVIKADGLAAGKGSMVCQSREEAQLALKQTMVDRIFKSAGKNVVIEEFMEGDETSLFVITDGKDYVTLTPAQDFKRALDGDQGKNTGGMGSYAPTPVLTNSLKERSLSEVVEPVIAGLQAERIDYRGMLYCGLMLTSEGPRVVEFNCRFGDPETQVVLPLLDSDLAEIFLATIRGEIGTIQLSLKPGHAVCVVAVSGGYPAAYEKGKKIEGLDQMESDIMVFHAGTRMQGRDLLTDGGRVLGVTATGKNLKTAVEKAYRNLEKINFPGIHYRRDIAATVI